MRALYALIRIAIAAIAIYASYNLSVRAPQEWWAYVTPQANLLAAVVMLWGAWALLADRQPPPPWVQATVTFYLVVVMIVYFSVIGLPEPLPPAAVAGIPNTLLYHAVTPVATLAMWVITVEHRRLRWWWAFAILTYFVLYLGFALLRGYVDPTARYPYAIINLEKLGWEGLWRSVALYVGFFAAGGLAMWGVDRALPYRTRATEPDASSFAVVYADAVGWEGSMAGHASGGTATSMP